MKYECPKCTGQLKYWEEYLYHKERTINKRTGKINKTVNKSNEVELDQHGLKCSSCSFHYYANVNGNEITYDYLDEILLTWRYSN